MCNIDDMCANNNHNPFEQLEEKQMALAVIQREREQGAIKLLMEYQTTFVHDSWHSCTNFCQHKSNGT